MNRAACYPALLGRGLLISADHLASAAGALPAPGFSGPEEVLAALGLSGEALYPHQQALLEAAESQILVAPTGAGKTECALLWSAVLRRKKGMRGRLFMLLPYQASLNAMATRLQERFGSASTAVVHGKTPVRSYQALTEAGYSPRQAQRMARHAEALARLNVAPVRLCTPLSALVLEQFLRDKPDGVLEELLVQELLDASYPRDLQQELVAAVQEKMQAFERDFVREMLPLGVSDGSTVRRLQEAWDELFDGVEVLPAAFLQEAHDAPTPLDVAQLLVPLSHRQFARLKGQGQVWWEDSLGDYITSSPYSTDTGLRL
ncbi:DEAD/DEAH box helicase [Desulfurispora thermophila]|uniref:DEAD/DEAH box helicase n=1 Tax=Desulfurispora thermophila TaxID=265470 RepID=UPI0003792BAB|nr:DEAD/DEAH box helicase [Desulfurispora thermophila]